MSDKFKKMFQYPTQNKVLANNTLRGDVISLFERYKYLSPLSVSRRLNVSYAEAVDICNGLEISGIIQMMFFGKKKGDYKYCL